MSYFVPVYPEECGETVRGIIINCEDLRQIQTSEIPVTFSKLQEVEKSEKGWQDHSFTFNSQACKEKGDDAEEKFLRACHQKGWTQKHVKEAKEYDYKHHVDAMIKIGENKEMWVDVKCCRALRRGWKEQSQYMWIELNNSGWLFGGRANIIAQKIDDVHFALLDRQKLCEYVKTIVQTHLPVVPYAEQSFNRVYIRESSKNGFTLKHALALIDLRDAYSLCGCGIIP